MSPTFANYPKEERIRRISTVSLDSSGSFQDKASPTYVKHPKNERVRIVTPSSALPTGSFRNDMSPSFTDQDKELHTRNISPISLDASRSFQENSSPTHVKHPQDEPVRLATPTSALPASSFRKDLSQTLDPFVMKPPPRLFEEVRNVPIKKHNVRFNERDARSRSAFQRLESTRFYTPLKSRVRVIPPPFSGTFASTARDHISEDIAHHALYIPAQMGYTTEASSAYIWHEGAYGGVIKDPSSRVKSYPVQSLPLSQAKAKAPAPPSSKSVYPNLRLISRDERRHYPEVPSVSNTLYPNQHVISRKQQHHYGPPRAVKGLIEKPKYDLRLNYVTEYASAFHCPLR
jgi:hypothetical protein